MHRGAGSVVVIKGSGLAEALHDHRAELVVHGYVHRQDATARCENAMDGLDHFGDARTIRGADIPRMLVTSEVWYNHRHCTGYPKIELGTAWGVVIDVWLHGVYPPYRAN